MNILNVQFPLNAENVNNNNNKICQILNSTASCLLIENFAKLVNEQDARTVIFQKNTFSLYVSYDLS